MSGEGVSRVGDGRGLEGGRWKEIHLLQAETMRSPLLGKSRVCLQM